MKRILCLAVLVLACGPAEPPDVTAPTVVSTRPADGATGWYENAGVIIYFSESMDTAATRAALSVSPALPMAGGKRWWAGETTLLLTPTPVFDSLTEYSVTIGTGARDLAGNGLVSPVTFSFTTGTEQKDVLTVTMFGRSVTEGWFYRWGWSGTPVGLVMRYRFRRRYCRLAEPQGDGSNTVTDFDDQLDSLNMGGEQAVFFKLCFVDFAGGDSASAQANLDRNKELVGQLCAKAANYDLPVIVGNALPVTEAEHDRWLYWNHRQYNEYLADLESWYPGQVRVFDLYSALVDPATHCIRHEYRSGEDDAHPNAAGYDALTPLFDAFLEENF